MIKYTFYFSSVQFFLSSFLTPTKTLFVIIKINYARKEIMKRIKSKKLGKITFEKK